jgi:hypothetical protein
VRARSPDHPLPDFERADRIAEFWGYPESRAFAELLIDCEEDRTLRAVLVGMLRRWAGSSRPYSQSAARRFSSPDPLLAIEPEGVRRLGDRALLGWAVIALQPVREGTTLGPWNLPTSFDESSPASSRPFATATSRPSATGSHDSLDSSGSAPTRRNGGGTVRRLRSYGHSRCERWAVDTRGN